MIIRTSILVWGFIISSYISKYQSYITRFGCNAALFPGEEFETSEYTHVVFFLGGCCVLSTAHFYRVAEPMSCYVLFRCSVPTMERVMNQFILDFIVFLWYSFIHQRMRNSHIWEILPRTERDSYIYNPSLNECDKSYFKYLIYYIMNFVYLKK